MNLQCRIDLGSRYKAGSQIARVLTEEWCARELYCPVCISPQLSASRANHPAVDFMCPRCEQPFQLKSRRTSTATKIVDSAYSSMIAAIRSNRAPNLLLLEYSSLWLVHNLLLIPRFFFSENTIEKRKALGPHARRAGWVGCNILLTRIPQDGRISIVSAGLAAEPRQVRAEFSRVSGLEDVPPVVRGWTVEVLSAIRRLGKENFSLSELYEREDEFKTAHPRNFNIRPKIRQQLQILRDVGLIVFVGPGKYALQTK